MRVKQYCPLVLLALIVTAWASTDFQKASTPALLWGSQNFFGPGATRVNYESLVLSDLWAGLMKSFRGDESTGIVTGEASSPELTVVFVGNQMRPSDLGEAKPIQTALGKSSSSLLFPNTIFQGDGGDFARVLADDAQVDAELVGSCGTNEEGETLTQGLEKAFAKPSIEGTPKVVVVCSSSENLAGEMSDFDVVMSVLEQLEKEYVVMYVSHESDSEEIRGSKRSLLSEEANVISYDTCEGICLTQVKFLEGIILALILSFALAAGLCCTHILDGPSQFEKAEAES